MYSLIQDRQVAFKEVRSGQNYVPKEGEILITPDVNIDECEGSDGSDASSSDEEGDELSISRRKRRLNARRVYETYLDEGLLDDVDDEVENTTTTARRAKLVETKSEAVRMLAAKRKKQQVAETKKKRAAAEKKTVEEDIRNKVRGYLEKSLRNPTKGLESMDDADLDHAGVAEMVESALYRLHGEVNQGYKQKASTLKFNLSGNEELRLHVLTGDIPAARLVEMDSVALASKELVEYRKKKEEQALKMSVLDTETAAKFSTAAALESAYSGYTGVKDAANQLERTTSGSHVDAKEADVENKDDGAEEQVDTQVSVKAVSSLDWKSIKSAQAQAGKAGLEPNVISGLQGIDVGGEDASLGATGSEAAAGTTTVDYDLFDLPNNQPSSHTQVECDEKLQKLFLANADPDSLRENVWEGTISVQSVGGSTMVASGLAGAGNLAELLGDSTVEVPGRLALDKLGDFLDRLRVSTSRTATVGVLSPGATKLDSTKSVDSSLIVSYYKGRDRAGSVKRTSQTEIFFIPGGDLAKKIINTCWHTGNRATIEACLGAPPLTLGPGQLVAVVVHPKDMIAKPKAAVAPPVLREPVRHDPVPMMPTAPSAPTAPVPMIPAAPTVAATSAAGLPAGLDLGAISNLAAAFGVADGVTNGASGRNAAPIPPPPPPPVISAPPALPTGLPANLDLGALDSLATALGVTAAPPPPPRNGANHHGRQ